ncbi:MAG TPA: sigma-70 family RNA polymerase sigma factor [candidate division Zixibacteria bacterium]|nr:sigma-70 family RNA polymerase sigma factor [candidate division Zixibacteria bacterium]
MSDEAVAEARRPAATLPATETPADPVSAAAGATAPARPPFAQVVREHLDRLYGFCLRLSESPADAEDLLQESLVRGMRAYPELHDPHRARGWLFAIATNVWRDQLRTRGRRVQTTSLDGMGEDDDDFSLFQTIAVEDPFPYSDELHLDFLRLFRDEDVRAVFGSINPLFRLPLILTVVHGFSCKEAAAVLGVPLGTLLSRLHRGRKQLERGLWEYALANGLVTRMDEP